MKGERILIADDDFVVRDGLQRLVGLFGEKDGHEIVGVAGSVAEVEALVESGVRPTVALVDNKFPGYGDGERAKNIIKKLSPDTIVISFSNNDGLVWGDKNWSKIIPVKELVEKLTELEHKKQ